MMGEEVRRVVGDGMILGVVRGKGDGIVDGMVGGAVCDGNARGIMI